MQSESPVSNPTSKAASSEAPKEKKVPDWAFDPFRQFIDHEERVAQILDLYKRGASMARVVPQAIKALHSAKPEKGYRKRLKHANDMAQIAEHEVKSEFPILNAMATVYLWTSLESLVKGYIATWIQHHPTAYESKALQSLKISVGEYESLKGSQRAAYLVDQLDRESGGPLKSGVSRFEFMLSHFGLGGEVDEKLRKKLFELHQIRNVLVHRRGIADRRFVEACGHLGFAVGAEVEVKGTALAEYGGATVQYCTEIIYRVSAIFGKDIRPGPGGK